MIAVTDRATALDLAVTAIRRGLRDARRWLPDVEDLPAGLRAPGASFVTLRRGGELRGCIGSLVAREALGVDVARHAGDAAFGDPRFEPVTAAELPELHVHVSVLGPLEPVPATDDVSLLAAVRPGVDGLLVEAGWSRGTLLPAVWESLPDPHDFLTALWRKAGLRPGSWPADLSVHRYTAEEFAGDVRDHLA